MDLDNSPYPLIDASLNRSNKDVFVAAIREFPEKLNRDEALALFFGHMHRALLAGENLAEPIAQELFFMAIMEDPFPFSNEQRSSILYHRLP